MTEPADHAVRCRAVDDCSTSFLVRAPAGSGKTGLLTQRFLALLARVDDPEEIIAITFTRKAAGEMRNRIVRALEAVATGATPPEQAHERRYFDLARLALARDAERGWGLVDNPGRLRVMTIDSLCASLARQMPVLSGFGSQPGIVEDAQPLYLEAARRTLECLEGGPQWSEPVECLLGHLDNQAVRLVELLAGLLARREQWLRHVAVGTNARLEREALETAFGDYVGARLEDVVKRISPEIADKIVEIARYAGKSSENDLVLGLADLAVLPPPEPGQLAAWQGIAALFLTQNGTWRKRIDAALGFPPPSKAKGDEKLAREAGKALHGEVIDVLSADPGLLAALRRVQRLPECGFADAQWAVLRALLDLLRIAAAQLLGLFQESGQVDFAQMAHAACQALGAPGEPSELALRLDYQVRHLLVDEFQDTSQTQFNLLEALTAGWTPDDGRTLFLVGDPMQSIYRFREAEVGLFQVARERGIGEVRPESLELTVNFRSGADVVGWVNESFPGILPAADDQAEGAVRFVPAVASRGAGSGTAVTVHPFLGRLDQAEAETVVGLVRDAKARNPQGSVGILVRGRGHLRHILPALRAAGIGYRAVDIDPLAGRPAVIDLLSLSCALLHPADRVAWLSVLRAPWCGLDLADLLALAGEDLKAPLPSLLQAEGALAALSADGRMRLDRVAPVLLAALGGRQRRPLRSWVEGAWLGLGGPAVAGGAAGLEDAEVFLQMLEGFEPGEWPDAAELRRRIGKLYALPDAGTDDSVQVMTLHKSKGLEFDTVIMPGLGKWTSGNDAPVLRWLELPGRGGAPDLLLAPIKATGSGGDGHYALLAELDKQRERLEAGRVLYVGVTRACDELHLLGHVSVSVKDGKPPALGSPAAGSLLAQLWPAVADRFAARLDDWRPPAGEASAGVVDPHAPLRRLPADWRLPAPPAAVTDAVAGQERDDPRPEFSWAGQRARRVGSVTHRALQYVAGQGREPAGLEDWARQALQAEGLAEGELDDGVAAVVTALRNTCEHERGRWILDAGHTDARNEYALSGLVDGELRRFSVDRTFVDADGVRWIVDYKTGTHAGAGLDTFLDEEQVRHRPQLETYARLLHAMDPRPVKLGLWFPALSAWREWSWSPEP